VWARHIAEGGGAYGTGVREWQLAGARVATATAGEDIELGDHDGGGAGRRAAGAVDRAARRWARGPKPSGRSRGWGEGE
jgi:hypothetical protein